MRQSHPSFPPNVHAARTVRLLCAMHAQYNIVWRSSTCIVHYACAIQCSYDVMRLMAYMVHWPSQHEPTSSLFRYTWKPKKTYRFLDPTANNHCKSSRQPGDVPHNFAVRTNWLNIHAGIMYKYWNRSKVVTSSVTTSGLFPRFCYSDKFQNYSEAGQSLRYSIACSCFTIGDIIWNSQHVLWEVLFIIIMAST